MLHFIKEDCVVCNTVEKYLNTCQCNRCPFSIIKPRFGDHEIIVKEEIGSPYSGNYKHWFYYYLYHPDLNWNNQSSVRLVVHHIDGNHYNNSKDNLQLLTFAEHRSIHAKEYNERFLKEGTHNFQIGNRGDIDKKVTEKTRERCLNGTHLFVTDNPSIRLMEQGIHIFQVNNPNQHNPKRVALLDFLIKLTNDYEVDIETRFGFVTTQALVKSASSLIKKHNLPIKVVIDKAKGFSNAKTLVKFVLI